MRRYTGRRVVTFHNQRDFIFFRHHRSASSSLLITAAQPAAFAAVVTVDNRYQFVNGTRTKLQVRGNVRASCSYLVTCRVLAAGDRASLYAEAQDSASNLLARVARRVQHDKTAQDGTFDDTTGEFEWMYAHHALPPLFAPSSLKHAYGAALQPKAHHRIARLQVQKGNGHLAAEVSAVE